MHAGYRMEYSKHVSTSERVSLTREPARYLAVNGTYGADGVWRWNSNGNVPFDDMLQDAGVDAATRERCRIERDRQTDAALAGYRERMRNYQPSGEELLEMRAAFGTGRTVVDVITGQEIQL